MMKLAGDLAEFALADLIQVQGLSGRTCALRVLATEATGSLFLVDGQLVHAVYEDLTGEDAFIALVATRAGYFQLDDGATTPERTLQGDLRRHLLDAAARIDDGTVPKPRRASAPALIAPRNAAPSAVPPPPRARPGRTLVLGGLAALLVLAVAGFTVLRHGAPNGVAALPGSTSTPPPAAVLAVEATALTGPRDALPALETGVPPAAPTGAALRPTIVCRLLVDAEGRVAEAKIYSSRLDLAAFEEAALAAVGRYRFNPGRRDGRPVPVWINWPVSFR